MRFSLDVHQAPSLRDRGKEKVSDFDVGNNLREPESTDTRDIGGASSRKTAKLTEEKRKKEKKPT